MLLLRIAALAAAILMASGFPPGAAAARAASAAPIDIAGLGFGGRVRLGAWTPVWIDVTPASNIDGSLVIEAPTAVGQPVVGYSAPVRAAAGARVRVFIPAIFYDGRQPGMVHLESGGQRLASVPLPRLRTIEELALMVSSEPLGVEAVAARDGHLEVVYLPAEVLPPVWQAYEAVRVVVIRNLDERRVDDAQREALRRWVWTGGRLVMMPIGDEVRHLQGPTLAPFRLRGPGGRFGRGTVDAWSRDPADPQTRGRAEDASAWEAALVPIRAAQVAGLEGTPPSGRAVPPRAYLAVAAMVVFYILAIRWLSRRVARMDPAPLAMTLVFLAGAAVAAGRLAVVARGEASGVVTSSIIEVMPGTGRGLLSTVGRVVSPHGGVFLVTGPPEMLLRPLVPAAVEIASGARTTVRGRGTGLLIAGQSVVSAPLSGSLDVSNGTAALHVLNRSGVPLESPWVFMQGRVHPLEGAIKDVLNRPLEEQRWQPHDRLQRTEPHHALLMWAFSRLEADAILKETPAWLVGWWRNPALGVGWDGRPEAPLQLVVVPLAASR